MNNWSIVARFWNEDGYEMPTLYKDETGELVCTWNWMLALEAKGFKIEWYDATMKALVDG